MASPQRLTESDRVQRQVEAEESRRVDDDAIEAFVWPQRCGDVASARQRTNVVSRIALKQLSSAARFFARHVYTHDAARETFEQLNLTSKRQPGTQHGVIGSYELRCDAFELARRRCCDYGNSRLQSCSEAYRANEHRTRHEVEAGISMSARARLGER